ncbi:flavin reductase [Micromonospora sp. MA102]|uniref:flavin reductase n=1 Tax=Micromonospora sp. MA102 TaxID=2952755 RepID=UPI0021C82A12|nr:flavin reductase [Micromonospora sp. MA102]
MISPDVSDRAQDPRYLRSVLAHYPTGVVAVTAMGEDGEPIGMVVGSFSSVSMDPPLVSFMPSRNSASFEVLRASRHFCVNVLGDHQEQVCRAFAVKGSTQKFVGLRWRPASSGAPILESAVAWIDCDQQSVIEAGDHYIVLGAVRDLATNGSAPELPLLFFQGGYGKFSPSSRVMPAAPDVLEQIRMADQARDHMDALARELGMECGAVAPVEDFLVRLASAGTPRHGFAPARVGLRLPFSAPMGPLLVAWAEPSVQQRWLDRGLPADEIEQRERHLAALARLRVRGWTVSVYNDAFRALDERLATGEDMPPIRFRDHLRAIESRLDGSTTYEHDLLPDELYQVRNVSAPVFDARGDVVMYLTLFGFPMATPGSRVLDVVNRLVHTASRVTDALSWTEYQSRRSA